ncbi:MAG: aminotransferase class V-fold PLP-dependent enzyme [Acidobacteriota bacterium]
MNEITLVANTKSRFPETAKVAYMDTAAEGLPPVETAQAVEEYLRTKSTGSPGRPAIYERQNQTERAAAQLLGTVSEHVALLGSASEGLNLLADSLDWREGDEVVINDLEFPSNVVAWLRLRRYGVKVRLVSTANGEVRLKDFVAQMGPRTRLVSVSAVSYKTGTRIPFLAELAEVSHRHGAIFCVDATQALGRVPVPLDGVDFLVSSSYKWLLGTHGLGLTYIAPALRERLVPGVAGWFSLDTIFHENRFESFGWKPGAAALQSGMPNFPAIFALKAGLDCLLETGVERIHAELAPIVAGLRSGLAQMGLQLLTPAGAEFASGIVAFSHDRPEALGEALRQKGVIVWAGDGRVRAAVHLYNDERDVARILDSLRGLV